MIDKEPFLNQDWSESVYATTNDIDIKEALSINIIPRAYVDADHAGDSITW